MSLMEVLILIDTAIIVFGVFWKLIEEQEQAKKKDYIAENLEVSLSNLQKKFEDFYEEVKVGYTKNQAQIIKKMQETEEELENRISNSQKHIAMLEKKLSQSKRKIERLKNENVRTE